MPPVQCFHLWDSEGFLLEKRFLLSTVLSGICKKIMDFLVSSSHTVWIEVVPVSYCIIAFIYAWMQMLFAYKSHKVVGQAI